MSDEITKEHLARSLYTLLLFLGNVAKLMEIDLDDTSFGVKRHKPDGSGEEIVRVSLSTALADAGTLLKGDLPESYREKTA